MVEILLQSRYRNIKTPLFCSQERVLPFPQLNLEFSMRKLYLLAQLHGKTLEMMALLFLRFWVEELIGKKGGETYQKQVNEALQDFHLKKAKNAATRRERPGSKNIKATEKSRLVSRGASIFRGAKLFALELINSSCPET